MRVPPPSPADIATSIDRRHTSASSAACILLATALANLAEGAAGDGRTERLGFRFDPNVRAAAVAASDQPAMEPPPAGVIRLPRHVVVGARVPFEGDDLLTPEGKVEVAKQRHLSPLYRATFGPLSAVLSLLNNPLGGWNPNGPEASALYEQAQQQRRSEREADLAGIAELAETAKKLEAAARQPKARNR